MKHKKNLLFMTILSFLFIPSLISASSVTSYVIVSDTLFASKVNLEKPNGSCLYRENGKYSSVYAAPGHLHCLDTGETFVIENYNDLITSTVSSCSKGFYYGTAKDRYGNSYNGYVCADNIKTNIDSTKYEKEFSEAGFPESYFERLTLLKEQHPNWKFTAYKTGLNWNDVVAAESVVGISLIQITDINTGAKYISLDEGSYDPVNKTYIVKEGTNWYAANSQIVAYYLDPRNFLTEKEIFMFENLGYNSNYQTLEVVQKILNNTDLYNHANDYIEAATYNGNNISPVSLAARSRQEIVKSDGTLSNAANGSGKINEISYYNAYNLGAFSTCVNPVACAIDFASGYEGTRTTYNRPWTTLRDSILNGASYIANGYINQKQNTLYFQKWNVTSNIYGNYSNQYMTNIKAAVSEANSTYSAYSKINGLLDSTIEFIIPVYENMPMTISNKPSSVDSNKKDEIENNANQNSSTSKVVDIVNSSGYKYSNDYISEIKIGTTASNFISNIKGASNSASVTITTIDSSGNKKEISDGTKLGTGDIITIKSGDDSKTFRAVIYGDVNGDGVVSAVDYVKIKNYIMQSGSLTGSYKIASDVNQDGNISAVDYVNIKNYIMQKDSVLK